MSKKSSIKYNGDTYIVKSQYDYDLYAIKLNNKQLQEENKRLLNIAKKMHTYIFLNTDNEQEAYDKLGLTEEENIMLGYSGQIIITGGDNNE